MKNLKRVLAGLGLALLLPCVLTAQAAAKKPGPGEIVIVARVSAVPQPNYAFFSAYNDPAKAGKGFEPALSLYSIGAKPKKSLDGTYRMEMPAAETGELGKMAAYRFELSGSGGFYLTAFMLPLSDCGDVMISLPVNAQLIRESGSRYLYAGSFTYSLEGDYMRVVSVKQSDEYDAAKDFVRERYGDAAAEDLVRVQLKMLP